MEQDQWSELRDEIDRLNARVEALEGQLREHVERPATAPRPAEAAPAPPRPAAPAVARTPRRRLDASAIEAEFGGNWLSRIGALALILGMGFFLKYAIDNRWINEPTRIMIGVFVGLAVIYAGEYFHNRRMPRYAGVVSGAGVAILYFTFYAAFAFYHLVPQSLAFGFMAVVTLTAVFLSIRHDSAAIAVLGILGGFLTPVMLQSPGDGSGGSSMVPVLTYALILDLGIMGITYYKDWRALNLLSFIGTVSLFFGVYDGRRLGLTMLFLTLIFVVFAAVPFVRNVAARRPMIRTDILLALASPVFYVLTSYYLLRDDYGHYLGLFVSAAAGFYLLLTYVLKRTGYESISFYAELLAVAAGLTIIAIPMQLREYWAVFGLAGEAAVLSAMAFQLRLPRLRGFAPVPVVLASIYLLFAGDIAGPHAIPFANSRSAAFLFVIAMLVLMSWLYHRHGEQIGPSGGRAPIWLAVGANVMMVWMLSEEMLRWTGQIYGGTPSLGSAQALAVSGVWAVYGVLLLVAGIRWRFRAIRLLGVLLLALVILKTFTLDVWALEKTYRIVAFLGLGILLLLASYIYQAKRDTILQLIGRDTEPGAEPLT